MQSEHNKFSKTIRITFSDCDYSSVLSYPDIFARCQDIATEQSELLGYDGFRLAPRGLFWVTTRYRMNIRRRPGQGEYVELSTWPGKPNRIRGNRYYTYTANGERIIEVTSEWAIVDRNTGKLYMISQLYDPDFEFYPEQLLPDGFHRFYGDFTEEPFAEYTVRSVDIDFEGHMNNVAYIRALFGLFPRTELDRMASTDIETYFKASCYEGDRLFWRKRQTENGLEVRAELADGSDIFYARIR